jgi:hypothetical protein
MQQVACLIEPLDVTANSLRFNQMTVSCDQPIRACSSPR